MSCVYNIIINNNNNIIPQVCTEVINEMIILAIALCFQFSRFTRGIAPVSRFLEQKIHFITSQKAMREERKAQSKPSALEAFLISKVRIVEAEMQKGEEEKYNKKISRKFSPSFPHFLYYFEFGSHF